MTVCRRKDKFSAMFPENVSKVSQFKIVRAFVVSENFET